MKHIDNEAQNYIDSIHVEWAYDFNSDSVKVTNVLTGVFGKLPIGDLVDGNKWDIRVFTAYLVEKGIYRKKHLARKAIYKARPMFRDQLRAGVVHKMVQMRSEFLFIVDPKYL